MSVQQQLNWITGEEFGEQRRRLLQSGLRDDAPEMAQLWARVRERDEYLWQTFAQPLMGAHCGEWAAVSVTGEVALGPTASAVMIEATERFGAGNFAYGKLAEFPGHDLSRC